MLLNLTFLLRHYSIYFKAFTLNMSDSEQSVDNVGIEPETEVLPGVEFAVPGTNNKVRKTVLSPGVSKGVVPPKAKVRILLSLRAAVEGAPIVDEHSDPSKPYEVTVAEKVEVPGLLSGLRTMKEKEKAEFWVEASMAYGDRAYKSLPPGTDVRFTIEMVYWTEIEDISTAKDNSVTLERIKKGDPADYYTPEYESEVVFDIDSEKDKTLTIGDDTLPVIEMALCKMKRGEEGVVRIKPKEAFLPIQQHSLVLQSYTRVDCWAPKGMEKVTEALRRKDEGNALLKQGLTDRAVKKYKRGLEFLSSDYQLTPEEKDARKVAKIALHNNSAVAEMQLGNWLAVVDSATKSIECDASVQSNVKAYLRRGAAHRALQNFNEARREFTKVLEADPANQDAVAELAKLTECQRAQDQKDKAMCAKMFK